MPALYNIIRKRKEKPKGKGVTKMKVADMEKTMTAVIEAVEKKYPGVKAMVKTNEWEKGDYKRLYINLICIANVNGEEKVEEADFGFINLKTNRYNVRGYDMRHFDADELVPAKMLYDYMEAYKTAESDKARYIAKENYRLTVGLSDEEQAKGISRKEMLDKSLEMGIVPSSFDTYWSVVGDVAKPEAEKESREESEEIGSYDGHSVTVKLAKNGKYIVEDNGKYTGDDGRDRDGGLYEAAMYLYDRLVEDGKTIKVEDDEARAYIVECAEGMKVKIVVCDDGTIKKED